MSGFMVLDVEIFITGIECNLRDLTFRLSPKTSLLTLSMFAFRYGSYIIRLLLL
jgi:hypothetical protein